MYDNTVDPVPTASGYEPNKLPDSAAHVSFLSASKINGQTNGASSKTLELKLRGSYAFLLVTCTYDADNTFCIEPQTYKNISEMIRLTDCN